MRKIIVISCLIIVILTPSLLIAVERAPRISDREIVERLTRLEEGQKSLEKRFDDVNRRIDDLRSEMNSRFNGLRTEMNSRFDTMQWMFGLFIMIALVILGFVLRMQWQMHRRQTLSEFPNRVNQDGNNP